MLGWIGFFLLLCGTAVGIVTGRGEALAAAVLDAPQACVTLLLQIGGTICFFSGLMRVAEASGLVDRCCDLLRRPVARLIPRSAASEEARRAVTLNLASNFFGLGNAATPSGIKASRLLYRGRMDRSLGTFLILNTCSVQLIPATVLALRRSAGSVSPAGILPQIWAVQILSCTCGVTLICLAFRREK